MYYIATTDKTDGDFKVYFEKTLEKAKELAAPLYRNFHVEIREMHGVKEVKKFIVKEEHRSFDEDYRYSATSVVAILDSYPNDKLLFSFASLRKASLKKPYDDDDDVKVKVFRNKLNNYCCGVFYGDDLGEIHEFTVEEESIFVSNKEEE